MTLKRLALGGILLLYAAFIIRLNRPVMAAAAPAAICTWPDSTTGNWTDASTWSCGVVPRPTDNVNVGLGGVIILNTNATISSLTMTGGMITGTGALAVSGLAQFVPSVSVTIHTLGSSLPHILSAPNSGVIVRLTDPALTADSLNTVTISNPVGSNGSTVFEIGPRSINTLIMHNGNFGVTSDLTVTQIVSWTSGSLNAYFNSPAHFTLANTAVMTIANGPAAPGLYLPLINEGTVTWLGTQSLLAGPKGTWTNNGTLNLYSAPIANVTFGEESVPFTNIGTLRVNATGDVQFDYALLNYGEVVLNSGALNMHWNNYTQWAGHTHLNGGNLAGVSKCCNLDNYPIYLYGGTLSGSGIITGGIENRGGTVRLTGALTATARYLQSVTGTLQGLWCMNRLFRTVRPILGKDSISCGVQTQLLERFPH